MKKIIVILIGIFVLGTLLRFYQLGEVPNSLNWDEVSWGYNAYSIATTGRDEYGSYLPLSFKAFGDFKQPVYVYLTAIPTLIFGLSAVATRFPSAFFGSLTILGVFFLTRELFWKNKKREELGLLAALLFAISPWSIQFSRVAFEANVGIFFTITGVALFLFSIRTNRIWTIILSAAVISLSCYTYHSQKLFTPLLFILLLFFSYLFWQKKRVVLMGVIVVFIISNIFWIGDSRTTARGRSVLFTSNQTQILSDSIKKLDEDTSNHDLIGKLFHNRRVVYSSVYLTNYLSHFSLDYLFLTGDNPRHHPPGMGNLYIISLPFIFLGILYLWKREKKTALLLSGWLLLAPIASALAVDAPNSSRSLVFLPVWDILTAFGILTLFELRPKWMHRQLFVVVIFFLFCVNFGYYLHQYFSHIDRETARDWQYGYREAILYAESYQRASKHAVYFSGAFEQPYIFYLFYAKVDPKEYIKDGGSARLATKCFSINKNYFGRCDNKLHSKDLFISLSEEKDEHLVKVKEINYPNDEVAIRIYQYKD